MLGVVLDGRNHSAVAALQLLQRKSIRVLDRSGPCL